MHAISTLRRLPAPPDQDIPPAKVVYKVDDRVWVRDSKYDTGFAPVFAPRWKGPFIVKQRLDKNVYRLRTDPLMSGKRSTRVRLSNTRLMACALSRAIEENATRVSDSVEGCWFLCLSFVIGCLCVSSVPLCFFRF